MLGKIVVILLAVVGGLSVMSLVLAVAGALASRPEPLPAKMVLWANLDNGIVEALPESPFARFTDRDVLVLSTVVQALDRASRDPRVEALAVRLDGARLGMATAQELREAVLAFRHAGKRAVLFSEDLGGSSVDTYLASAFSEVWLQPSGEVGLIGFVVQSPFVKGTLALLGIEPEFASRWEYKSFAETFTRDRHSNEARESLDALVDAWTAEASEGIATDRGLKPDEVRALMDKGPFTGDEAKQAKLVDRLGYWDELQKTLVSDGAQILGINAYARRLSPQPEAVNVALIVGAGEIHSGDDEDSSTGGLTIAADRMTEALRAAVKDPAVKAILLRVDSPGGSYPASDAIWREVSNARAAGKPVVVSMGDYAASGGYFISMAADWIVAQPGTITGSIGVLSGKFVLAGLWNKIGVSWDEVRRGENADMDSANQPFTQEGWDRLNASLDHAYADFTAKAAQARKLDATAIDAAARGRVWSGDAALAHKLVDQLGGYPEAFTEIRKLARLPSQMPLRLMPFPRPRTPYQELIRFARSGALPDDLRATLAAEARLAAILRPLADIMAGDDETLRMPPIETR